MKGDSGQIGMTPSGLFFPPLTTPSSLLLDTPTTSWPGWLSPSRFGMPTGHYTSASPMTLDGNRNNPGGGAYMLDNLDMERFPLSPPKKRNKFPLTLEVPVSPSGPSFVTGGVGGNTGPIFSPTSGLVPVSSSEHNGTTAGNETNGGLPCSPTRYFLKPTSPKASPNVFLPKEEKNGTPDRK
jgi:hypothetical protein